MNTVTANTFDAMTASSGSETLVELTEEQMDDVNGGFLVLALFAFDAAILTYDLYLATR